MSVLSRRSKVSGWLWVPSLYFAEGIPYVVAMIVSVVMYKNLGVSNAAIAFWTSLLYLPWVIKPFWSPFVDILSTKRSWILIMQLILAVVFFLIAISIPLPIYFYLTLFLLWIVAFSSATHDIAADGFYMLGLDKHEQAFFVGIRSTFYRIAMITGQGLIVMLAGLIQSYTGLAPVDFEVRAVSPSAVVDTSHVIIKGEIKREGEPGIVVSADRGYIRISGDSEACSDTLNVYVCLSSPPRDKKEIVVNFGFDEGNKDIYLVSQARFEFDKSNWNVPRKAQITVNPRLKEEASAVFKATAGNVPFSWTVSFLVLAVMFLLFVLYHRFMLPYPSEERKGNIKEIFSSYADVFITFFKKERIWAAMAFLLFYRFAESQLVKIASPFLLDAREVGGLGLTTTEVGFVYGTVGIIALTVGGILGGIVASAHGLKKWIWWMAIAINVPDGVYLFLSYYLPDNFLVVNACVAVEQFGYGFGFTGYMLYMIYIAQGKYKTAHFAITTGFMALGMMLPGMISGKIEELLGYQYFFIYVLLCTAVSFLVVALVKIDPEFGKKVEKGT